MRKLVKRLFAFVLCIIQLFLLIPFAFAVDNSTPIEYDNISIGAGGSFYFPLIDPTDSDNYIVSTDMGGVYYSDNRGESWERNNTHTTSAACISDNGVLFVGSYGLFASHDNGETLELIYPQADKVKYSISRYGKNDNTMLADGYDNGYVVAVDTCGDYVYFVTIDWSVYGNLRFGRCLFDGSGLEILYTAQVGTSPMQSTWYMVAEEDRVILCDGTTIWSYELSTKTLKTKYTAPGKIIDFEMIGEYLFFLIDEADHTNIIYTDNIDDFSSVKYLNEKNHLSNTFTRYRTEYSFEWHFSNIAGNNFENIWLAFNSVSGGGNLSGVLKFNGSEFEWAYDNIFNPVNSNTLGWNGTGIYPIYDLYSDPNDDDHCLMTNINTVYDIYYNDETDDQTVNTLHCTINGDGTYTTTGLDCQTTYFVHEDPFNEDHIIISTTDIGLQISYDGGESFRRMYLTYEPITNTCYDLYFDENTEGLVYGLWSSRHDAPYSPMLSDKNAVGAFSVSYDGGITWDHDYSTGLPKNSIPVNMSVVPNGDELMIAVATFNNGFYISYDSGKTFSSISNGMASYNGMIWGEDVVIVGNDVYCLTAYHSYGGLTPSVLYKYNLKTGKTTSINMGEIIIARSLTYHEDYGLYLNATPYCRWEWVEDLNRNCHANYGGGVYRLFGSELVMTFSVYDGAFNSAITSDGTMYVAGELGTVYVVDCTSARVYADGLFRRLKNISFSGDEETMYVTTIGGGTYRMATLSSKPDVELPEPDDSIMDSVPLPDPTIFTVTFQDHDGTVLHIQQVYEGGTAAMPEAPVREPDSEYCYTFSGWDKDITNISSDLIVTATYTAKIHSKVTVNTLKATCTTDGYTGDIECADCGFILSSGHVTPAHGHVTGNNVTNNNGTHSTLCYYCKCVLSTENCTDTNGDNYCEKCGYKIPIATASKLTRTSGFTNGGKYLITRYGNTGLSINHALNYANVVSTDNNGTKTAESIPDNVQWIYYNGKLYTIYNGQTYYLTVIKLGYNNYCLGVTTTSSGASSWNCTSSTLSTKVDSYRTRYLSFNSYGANISSSVSYVTIYQINN